MFLQDSARWGHLITKAKWLSHSPDVVPYGFGDRNSLQKVLNGRDSQDSVDYLRWKLLKEWQSCWTDEIARLCGYFHPRREGKPEFLPGLYCTDPYLTNTACLLHVRH